MSLYAVLECQKENNFFFLASKMSLNASGNWTKMFLRTLEKLWDIEQNLFGLSRAPFLNAEGHVLRFS